MLSEEIGIQFSENELLDMTRKLISIPSHTASDRRERDIASYIAKLLESEGVEHYLQPADGDRCNVIAILRGDGTGKSLMLNGHLDTVPVSDMADPFGGIIRDGFLYGRGACDMKSGLAAMLYTLLLLHRSRRQLKGDLVFAGVIDEEAAKSTGSRVLVDLGPRTDFAIVGEPTNLRPVTAHSGIDYFGIDFFGVAAHSSTPQSGASAIYAAADYVRAIRDEIAPMYVEQKHPLIGHSTINVGLIMGSAKANRHFLLGESETFAGIVPDETAVYVDVRWTPCLSVPEITCHLEQLVTEILSRNPGVDANVVYIPLPRPAMEISPNSLLAQTLLKNTEAISPSTATATGVSYFADSGILYGIGGIESIIFGPGDISVAHGRDEKVEIEQIYKAAKIYTQTAIDICGV